MNVSGCERRGDCTVVAVIISIVAGVIAAFLRITGTITVTPAFLWVTFGVAVVYLALLFAVSALKGDGDWCTSICGTVTTLVVALVVTVLLSVVLLAISFVATSVTGAVITGLLIAFFFLVITTTACLVRCLFGCNG